jgi:putative restriction endonuclease
MGEEPKYHITERGLEFLKDKGEVYDSIISQGFSRTIREKETENDYEDIIIEEGEQIEVSQKHRKRSQKLRELKIKQLQEQNNGKLECCVCGFNFEEKYDGSGEGFIHIHHTSPMHTAEITGNQQKISDALKKVVPLCSNCHSMIHRDRDKMLSVEELKEIIKQQER